MSERASVEPRPDSATGAMATARATPALVALLALPLLPLLLVLWHWGTAGAEIGYWGITGNSGEFAAGQKIGQGITPLYPGLSAIGVRVGDYNRVNTGTLTLRLFEDGSNTEIRRAALPKEQMRDNPVVWFQFEPLADTYRGSRLRFELEDPSGVPLQNAITFFINDLDSYSGGMAYFDGRARPGTDLVVGMRYSASAPEIWVAQLGRWAGTVTPPLALLAGAVLAGLLAGSARVLWILGGRVRRSLADGRAVDEAGEGSRGLRRLALITLLGLSNAVAWAIFVPAWHGPDEPAHFAHAALIAKQGTAHVGADEAIRASVVASMDRRQFLRYVPWAPEPGASADRFLHREGVYSDTFWGQTRQPTLYYLLLAAAFQLPGLAPDGPAWPDVEQAEALLYTGRLVSALLHALVVALGVLAGRALRMPGAGEAIGITLALLPMPAHIHSTVNNDALAGVAGAVLALYAFRALQRFRFVDLPLLVAGAALAYLSKSTVMPVVALALLALAAGMWLRARAAAKIAIGVAILLALILPVALFYGSIDAESRARNWIGPDFLPAPRLASPDAFDGSYLLAPAPATIAGQRVDLPPGHGVVTATASIWVRGEGGEGTLGIGYNQLPVESSRARAASGEWQRLETSMVVPAEAIWLSLELRASGGRVEFDDASLTLEAAAGNRAGEQQDLLQNPSFETAARVVPTNLPGLRPGSLGYIMLDYLADPVALDRFWLKQASLFRSFWANFGWVAVELPDWTYGAWAVLLAAALIGGLVAIARGVADEAKAGERRPYLAAAMAGVVLTLVGAALFAFLRTAAGFKAYHSDEFPQGRYLFPLLVPAIGLLVLGLAGWARVLRSGLAGRSGRVLGHWSLYLGAALLVSHAALALTTIFTFYHGR